ncbi:MAG: response regulator [Deltaproteobacteria bacterium]|nr:response regulator [Deltaproteobacteria bacterium]
MKENNSLLSIPQAAGYCFTSRVTLWRWVKSGKLKAFISPGGQYKIRKKDLEAFISEKMIYLPLPENPQSKTILIVDDDPGIRDLLTKMLSAQKYETEVASSGFEAGAKVVKLKPGLIILDLIMPGMDGFEVCRRIKENPDTSHIKILAFTGYDTKENREKIMKAGADGYMVKPVERDVLLRRVEDLLIEY